MLLLAVVIISPGTGNQLNTVFIVAEIREVCAVLFEVQVAEQALFFLNLFDGNIIVRHNESI